MVVSLVCSLSKKVYCVEPEGTVVVVAAVVSVQEECPSKVEVEVVLPWNLVG